MKILLVSAALPPRSAGESEYACQLAIGLSQLGHSVTILTSKDLSDWHHPEVRVLPVATTWSWRDLPRLSACLRHEKPDAVLLLYLGWLYSDETFVTHLPQLVRRLLPKTSFTTLFFNVMGARSSRASLVSLALHRLSRLFNRTYMGYEFGTLLSSNKLVFLATDHLRSLQCIQPEIAGKATVVPPFPMLPLTSLSRQQARAKLSIPDDDFVFLNYGHLYPGKGIETLLAAMASVVNAHSKARLHFLGGEIDSRYHSRKDYFLSLTRLASKLGISEVVHWHGSYGDDYARAAAFFRAADACVLPFDVGLGMNNSSAATAIAASLPLVSTHREEAQLPFEADKNVLLVPPKNATALSLAMKRLILNPSLLENLRNETRDLGRNFFSRQVILNQIANSLV